MLATSDLAPHSLTVTNKAQREQDGEQARVDRHYGEKRRVKTEQG